MITEKEFVFRARQFIDATGDATVGYLAGADWRYGREGRAEFGENLAPVEADGATMGATITLTSPQDRPPYPFQGAALDP